MRKSDRFGGVALLLGSITLLLALVEAADQPAIMQAEIFGPSADEIGNYWVSEKLDGIRGRWDGKKIISKNGHKFSAPDWFTAGFPDMALDGELWSARGQYQQIASIVGRDAPHDGWRQIKFMVFDLPNDPRPFAERVAAMRRLARQSHSPYLVVIRQFQVESEDELMRTLDEIVAEGGEGLMLHHKDAFYHHGRSNKLLKLKPYRDAEAVVIGYRPGKGRFAGLMGAVKVRTEYNKEFYIGSGFSHRDRENPPPLGSRITFRYQGLTDNGTPRFAVFMRRRDEP